MPDQIWWYVSRASGIVTLAASGLSIIWGLLLSTRVIRHRSLPKWLLDLHRFLGAIAVSFLAVHLGALIADNFVHFGLADLTIPGHSDWKTGAVAWGIVSMYLLVSIQATSLLKRRIRADSGAGPTTPASPCSCSPGPTPLRREPTPRIGCM